MEDSVGALGRRKSLVASISKTSRFLLTRRSTDRESFESTGSCSSNEGEAAKKSYRVLILGAARVGKTAIISQFLYDSFICGYRETVHEMYHGQFQVGGSLLTLDIQDTGPNYVDEFPAMFTCSLTSVDAVILVFSVSDLESFDEVSRLRDLVQRERGEDIPIVVVGNKTDLPREISREEAEATVLCDWENGYQECCAKDNINISAVFLTLLMQAKSFMVTPSNHPDHRNGIMTRRKSSPQVPVFSMLQKSSSSSQSPSFRRRASVNLCRRDSCKQQ